MVARLFEEAGPKFSYFLFATPTFNNMVARLFVEEGPKFSDFLFVYVYE